jgi:transposase
MNNAGAAVMMGRRVMAEPLFYNFRLEDHVPADHVLRGVDQLLDAGFVRKVMAPHYATMGRPSIDPELMTRMLLIGYLNGIRSERRLCAEVHPNLAYRWFCRLGLDGPVPDHSTFSKNRHGRFRESDLFRQVFDHAVHACMRAGLVGGHAFAIDASVIEADASRGRKVDGKLTEWPEDETVTRPVREYIATLEEAAKAEEASLATKSDDEPPGQEEPRENAPSVPKVTSLTDPAAAWTSKGQMKVGFAYGVNYMIDTRKAVIVDVEATPARWSSEVAATKTMLQRIRERLDLKPSRLAADAAYGSGLMLHWLIGRGIEPHIPLLNGKGQNNGLFTRTDFRFDADANVHICPNGKQLRSRGLVRDGGNVPYWASTKDCRVCPLKSRCITGAKRIVTRNIYEGDRARVGALHETPAFKQSARERKKVEMSFAHLKRHMGFRRLRLRGLTGAADEFHLAAAAQNIKKLIRSLFADGAALQASTA